MSAQQNNSDGGVRVPQIGAPSFGASTAESTAAVKDATAAAQSKDSKEYEASVFKNFMNLQRRWALNPPPEDPMRVGESCASKAAISTAVGGAMGVVVGLVFGTMGGMQPGAMLMPGIPEPPRKAWRHEIRDSLRQTRYKARSWAKNFAFISGTYSGVECVVEKMRGKHDVLNSVGAGCITGAGLAISSGPQVRPCIPCVCCLLCVVCSCLVPIVLAIVGDVPWLCGFCRVLPGNRLVHGALERRMRSIHVVDHSVQMFAALYT